MASRKNDKYIESKRGRLISLLIASFVLLLSVGYTALNEELTISGEASFRVEGDIRVTGINILQTTNSSIEDYNPTYGKDSIKIGVTLPSNQSTVTYKVKIANYSNVAMKIAKIDKVITNNNYTITFNKTLPLTIGKLSEEEIEITFKNNTSASQIVESALQFTFEKLEAVMTQGGVNGGIYNGSLTKDSIESITFMSTKEIPEDAVGYWDCSYVQGKNEVVAYYLNSETEGMYDLYIAADGEVYAPANSIWLFFNLTKLKSIDFNNSFNTSKVTIMGGNVSYNGMFRNCSSLEELDLSRFDTSKVTNMQNMFLGCSKLTELDVSTFDTSNVTIMSGMFSGCISLKELDLSNFKSTNLLSISNMFERCSSLESINFGNDFSVSKVKSLNWVFYNCKNLKFVDLSHFNTSNVTSMNQMFRSCSSLEELDLSGFDVSNVTDIAYMLGGCSSLRKVNFSNWSNDKLTSISGLFSGLAKLEEIKLKNFNMPNVTNMSNLFSNDRKLTTVDLSSFDITNVTNMNTMFYNCTSLTNLDIRTMDFENKTVTTTNMFQSVPSGINIYVLNEYNKNYIEGLKSNAHVIVSDIADNM